MAKPRHVDHGAVLADVDRLGLRVADVQIGERGEQRQILLGQRTTAAGECQVQTMRFVGECVAQVEQRRPRRRAGQERLVHLEHLLVRVLVPAVAREVEEIDQSPAHLPADDPSRTPVAQRVRDARVPELQRLGHVRWKLDEVRVVLGIVADQLPH
ncbi:hypothetical protein LRS13_04955 [Svornostia abyssi]|uniref:Uncharacterized protein n=1 Tax=Svornostia abyssi TaxID=2898438 RepID=A0ABY5PKK7_9ACTN|nr:hypothetical protein LRS13_04955 [Parviterribacteraceae bacterium J379]